MRMDRRVCALALLAVAGCARTSQVSKDVSRLRSDVTLLNERVSQIERSGTNSSASSTSTWDPLATPTTDVGAPKAKTTPAPIGAKPAKKDIQLALKNAGLYTGAIDGKFGSKTREAVKEFQRANGLKVDGVVGRQTWDKLSPYLDLSGTANLGAVPDTALK